MFYGLKNILYVSDLNIDSRPAFRAAVSLCGHYSESQIAYLYVIEPVPGNTRNMLSTFLGEDELDGMLRKSFKELKSKIRQRIEDFCAEELEEHEVLSLKNIHTFVEEGTPWRKILEVADEMKADVIVMGTRKHGVLEKALVGSTAAKVLAHSKRPILIVPLR